MSTQPAQQHINHHDRLVHFARLVRQLRKVQKDGGKGYTTPAVGKQASSLEQQVDAHLNLILGPTP